MIVSSLSIFGNHFQSNKFQLCENAYFVTQVVSRTGTKSLFIFYETMMKLSLQDDHMSYLLKTQCLQGREKVAPYIKQKFNSLILKLCL